MPRPGPKRSAKVGLSHALGQALTNSVKKRADDLREAGAKVTGVAESQAARSVLEQSSLDDFIATAELARATFEANRGRVREEEMVDGPQLVSGPGANVDAKAQEALARQMVVPIPWRPQWREGMSAEELAHLEGESFLEWRRGLAQMEEEQGLAMTPFERNLDFWRQLWRCVERSDLLVQILDARDPDFYRSKDLERYVSSFPGKRHMLLLNKSDFLSAEMRQSWREHLAQQGVDAVFFSALRELHRQERLPDLQSAEEDEEQEEGDQETQMPAHGPLNFDDDPDVADCARLMEELSARMPAPVGPGGSRRGVVGFVGYPNVGKSSVINALFGAKKVSMSRTPGKTKHLQTLELPDANVTLCDCPGLVFPSVVATKAHLVINGTVPLTELRDSIAPVRLIVGKIGLEPCLLKYSLSPEDVKEGVRRRAVASDDAHQLLSALAFHRQHFLRLGVPDETWAARKVLRDYCNGHLLHCEHPPNWEPASSSSAPADAAPDSPGAAGASEDKDSDFSDLDSFLKSEGTQSQKEKHITKRKMRHMNKQMMRGAGVGQSVMGVKGYTF